MLSGLTVQLRSQAERIQRGEARTMVRSGGERGTMATLTTIRLRDTLTLHWAHRDNYSGDTGDSVHILNDCLVTWCLPSMGES